MASWHERIPPHAVVRVLPQLGAPAFPPPELPQPPRWGPAPRRLMLTILVLAALAVMAVTIPVWTGDTPGLWFNILFTVLPVAFGLGLLLAAYGWHLEAGAEERVRAQWRAMPPTGPPQAGVVADRHVSIGSESGEVTVVALRVQVGGELLAAAWRLRGQGTLLQPQVPVVGSPVRIWRGPDGALLVDAVDPSAIPYPGPPLPLSDQRPA